MLNGKPGPNQYDPNLGFIGHVKVDVANYLFKNSRKRIAYAHSRSMVKSLLDRSPKEHFIESQKLTKFIRKRDLTFQKSNAKGEYKIFTVPCTTTIVPLPKSTFNQIERAAQVLVVALRAVIQDLYGSKSVSESGFVKSLPKDVRQVFVDAVESSPNYFTQLHHPNMKKYPFFDNVGLDLVLVEDYLKQAESFADLLKAGRLSELPQLPFRILELNAGAPSGASNNMNILEGLHEINPETLKSLGKMMPNDHFEILADTYRTLGEDWTGIKDGVQVILPPGGLNGAAPEIHNLATYSGLIYADPMQLFCDDQGYIRLRTINGSNPIVTAVYSRINADSALFDPEKDIILRDADTGEPFYLRDTLKMTADGKSPVINDVNGKPVPLQSDYAVPGLLDAILNRRIYMGGLNRILDNKIILATLTSYAPEYFEKKIKELGLELDGPKILTPETLPPKKESVTVIEMHPEEWVVKAPNLSGGTGVYILKTLSKEKQKFVLDMIRRDPTHFAYQKLVKIARIPVATESKGTHRFANLAADIRLWIFYGGGSKALPRMTHNALVRYAPHEKGAMSSIVNTSKGGGYAPFVVIDDVGDPKSVYADELVKRRTPVPMMTHLPMFVAAQLIQVSRLALDIKAKLDGGQGDTYDLIGLILAMKGQCREILSFINPSSIELVYKMIDLLEKKQDRKAIAAFFYHHHANQIRITNQLQKIEAAKKLTREIRLELDKLHVLNEDLICDHYTEQHRTEDLIQIKNLRKVMSITSHKDKAVQREMRIILKVIRSSIGLNFPREVLSPRTAKEMSLMIADFMNSVRERLQNSEKAIEFAKLFRPDTKHPELRFEALGLASNPAINKKGPHLTASQKEFATGELLIESDFVSLQLKEARKAWLDILATSKKYSIAEKEKFLERERVKHFKRFPFLNRYQELIETQNASLADLLELMPVMPYAHYNLEQLAKSQGLSIEDIFTSKLTPNKISILSSRQIKNNHLSAREDAGECFAKKRKSHGLFSDSDIFIWIRKEMDPLTQIYTAGHEVIHYHQIAQTTRMEATSLSDGAIAQAYFLNFYGNFLGISNASLESLSVDISVERQPLYGLTDRIVPFFFTPVIAEVRHGIQKGGETYDKMLNKYGSLFGYMCPNSTQVRVKALQEILPALENAKNIRFAKELGLNISWDEIRSALPSANPEQIRVFRPVIERLMKRAEIDHESLRVIGNHQFHGVSFSRLHKSEETIMLRPILSSISLGNSYNQTQQQQ